jgi:hypothetical protein
VRPIVLAGFLATLLVPSVLCAQDWRALDAEEEIRVQTRNEDGSTHEKTIWLVVVDGQPYIRPYSRTRWVANLKRDPDIVLEIADTEYPLRAEVVTDPAHVERVQAAFREKYGFGDRITGVMSLMLGAKKIYRVEGRP